MSTPDELAGITWRKSSRSDNASGSCVEVGAAADGSPRVAVRDTKDHSGPMLVFPAAEWSAFLTAIKSHTFDL